MSRHAKIEMKSGSKGGSKSGSKTGTKVQVLTRVQGKVETKQSTQAHHRYDYCVVGAGPTGITAAWYLSKHGHKVCLIDSEPTIGGCHRVVRDQGSRGTPGLFSEHSPRSYSASFVAFQDLLADMGLNFYDIFVPYGYGVSSTITYLFQMSLREIFWLGITFIRSIFVTLEGTVDDFCKYYNLSANTSDILDRSCRLFEGSGADRFGINELMNILSTLPFYNFYQPSAPNDELLMKAIEKRLINKGVKIMVENRLETIILDDDKKLTHIYVTDANGSQKKIRFNHLILAIPPKGLRTITAMSPDASIRNCIKPSDEFYRYVKKTAYLDYIPIVFFWPLSQNFTPKWGFPIGPWGAIRIKVSDYYKDPKRIIMSITLSKPDGRNSDYLTPAEYLERYGDEKFAEEIYQQIKAVEPTFPKYKEFVFRPTDDTSFIITKEGFLDYNTKIPNMYVVGTMNGNTTYPLTTFESAVRNANFFIESHTKGTIKIKKPASLLNFRNIIYPLVQLFHIINEMLGYIFGKNSKF